MIKRLQKKFIAITTSVFILIIGLFFIVANVVNYISTNHRANLIMDILIKNNGMMPFIKDNPKKPTISPETFFETRFFTVSISNSQQIIVNIDRIAAINYDTAKEYALKLYSKGKVQGYSGNYKYKKIEIPNGVMYIFLDCSRELSSFKNFLLYSAIISIVIIALTFILIVVISNKAIKPFIENDNKQKRFITDANHEIKTPLSIIQASNEVLELEYGKNEWTNSIHKQITRLTTLTEKLIFLSRMDEDNAKIQMNNFSLSNTVNEIATSFLSMAKIANKIFEIQIDSNIEIYGDVSLIGQLIVILLDNAFKYSNENGIISIHLFEKNRTLIVKNTVDFVEKGNLNHYFNRFYRPDLSKNASIRGFGIGLSVAEAIVKLHKGKINARSEDSRTFEIKVTFERRVNK